MLAGVAGAVARVRVGSYGARRARGLSAAGNGRAGDELTLSEGATEMARPTNLTLQQVSAAADAMRAAGMEPTVSAIAAALKQADVAHADETGVRCAGKTRW